MLRRLLLLAVYAAAALSAWLIYRWLRPPSGPELNRLAWEAAFSERGLRVPPGGPRDGYWGRRLRAPVRDPETGWREAEAHIPGLVESDAMGVQTAGDPAAPRHLLIVGGSVAWGAYASSIDATYFTRLARQLSTEAPVRISVLAAGAWESGNELSAFRSRGLALRPDAVLFLDGLNDLTHSGRRHQLDRSRVPAEERVQGYLANMEAARRSAFEKHVPVVFSLQPFLLDKKAKSRLEKRILALTLDEQFPEEFLRRSYTALRSGLRALAQAPDARFIDCSGVFDAERPTTFTDIWHFPDPGHSLLAECLARKLRNTSEGVWSRPGGASGPGPEGGFQPRHRLGPRIWRTRR